MNRTVQKLCVQDNFSRMVMPILCNVIPSRSSSIRDGCRQIEVGVTWGITTRARRGVCLLILASLKLAASRLSCVSRAV